MVTMGAGFIFNYALVSKNDAIFFQSFDNAKRVEMIGWYMAEITTNNVNIVF